MTRRDRTLFRAFGGRRFNGAFILRTLVVLALSTVTVVLVHRLQRPKIATFLRSKAEALAAANELPAALRYQRLFVRMNPDDQPALAQLGLWLAAVDTPGTDFEALPKLQQALRRDDARTEVREALLEIALRRGLTRDAVIYAETLEKTARRSAQWQRIAEAYQLGGRVDAAVAASKRAVDADPRNLPAWRQYVQRLYARSGKAADVESAIGELVAANRASARAYLVVHVLRRDLALPGADEALAEARRRSPDDLEVVMMEVGQELNRNPEKATALIKRAQALAPDDARVLLVAGRFAQVTGRGAEAQDLYRRGFDASGGASAPFAWRLAEMDVETGKWNGLVPYFDVIRRDGRYRAADQFLRGRLDQLQGKFEPALAAFNRAKAILGNSGYAYMPDDALELLFKIELGVSGASFQLGKPTAALNAAVNATRLSPDSVVARMTLGGLYFETRQFERAADEWLKVRSSAYAPPFAGFEVARSLLYMELAKPPADRKWATYQAALAEADRRAPDLPDLALLRADEKRRTGDDAAAISVLTAASQGRPNHAPTALSLLKTLSLVGKPSAAASYGRRVERTFGSSLASTLAIAGLHERVGEIVVAIEKVKGFLTSGPAAQRGIARRYAAHLLWGDGRFGDARAEMERAIADDPMAWPALFELLLEVGDYEAAVTLSERLVGVESDTLTLWRWSDARLARLAAAESPASAVPTLRAHANELRRIAPYWWGTAEVSAWLAEATNDREEALRNYREAILGGPAYASTRKRARQLLADAGRLDDFRDLQRQALGQSWPQAVDRREVAEEAFLAGDVVGALASGDRLLAAGTAERKVADRQWYATLLTRAKRVREAERLLAEATDLPSSTGGPEDSWRVLSRYSAQQRLVSREEFFSSVASRSPVAGRALRLGLAAVAYGDMERAVAELSKIDVAALSAIDARSVWQIARDLGRPELVPVLAAIGDRFRNSRWRSKN